VIQLTTRKTTLTPDLAIGNPSSDDRAAYDSAGNVQIDSILGASWQPSTSADGEQAKANGELAYEIAARREMERLEAAGSKPYFIPSGASLHPLGGLGFARWAFELEQQEQEMGVRWDAVIMSCASGSTLGGMVAGFKLIEKERALGGGDSNSNRKRRLIGIQATTVDVKETERVVMQSAKNTAKLIGLSEEDISADAFEITDRFNAGAYAKLDDKTREGIKLLAETEGILTDPVYTGKAVTGLIALSREGAFDEVENVLFVHTGGTPALSAYPSMR
jgi:1-aminocyclopropane-1-carboxylate deaminase